MGSDKRIMEKEAGERRFGGFVNFMNAPRAASSADFRGFLAADGPKISPNSR
jgi:hypothetical protein